MQDLPIFQYFRDPVREGVFERSEAGCFVCGRARGWVYTAGVYGPDVGGYGPGNRPPLCPWCIEDGSAAALGWVFNDATYFGKPIGSLPSLPEDEAAEVEGRTPGFVTWQGNHWMQCCGHACVYLGEADAEDLQGRWAAAVPSILEDLEWSDEEKARLIRSVKKGAGPCAYVFECRVCGGLCGYWDTH